MPTVNDLLTELKSEVTALECRFIDQWVPAQPQHTPADFQHDVKAYCVLAHAAMEEFVEAISQMALEEAEIAWQNKTFSRATISALMFYKTPLLVVDGEKEPQERIFDQIRKALDECKSRHSNALANNHGFSLKYLRSMLTPVGIDVPEDVRLMQSLQDLAEARGSFAHSQARLALYGRSKRAKATMAPENAKSIAHDCLELCERISAAFIPSPPSPKGFWTRLKNLFN